MARIVILGGGFSGVIAAEALAKKLGNQHEITLVARQREFTFYPALVRLAFGQCEATEVFYDLEGALLDQRVRFIHAEVLYPDPLTDEVHLKRGTHEFSLPYDYLIIALGRRLATESVKGFDQHAHHCLSVSGALRFAEAVRQFHQGHAVIGYCPEARLTVPVLECAFALDKTLRARGERDGVKLSLVSPEPLGEQLGGDNLVPSLERSLAKHDIELMTNFPIDLISENEIWARDNRRLPYDLLMLLPPFQGPDEIAYRGMTDMTGFVQVNRYMQVLGTKNVYAAGDCVSFIGPKMGHLAVLQAEVAAANLIEQIAGREPSARYEHDLTYIINDAGGEAFYLHKDLWEGGLPVLRQGRFWSWAKQVYESYWTNLHGLKTMESANHPAQDAEDA